MASWHREDWIAFATKYKVALAAVGGFVFGFVVAAGFFM